MTADAASPDGTMRLNQFLARAGFGSRRGVEQLVRDGRVTIDGETVHGLSRRIDPGRDAVAVDGLPARLAGDTRVYAFHKPRDVVSSLRAQGDQTALDGYRERADIAPRFHPVGRLDRDSSGLLLWTDDGRLSQALMRPEHEVWKTYEVRLATALKLGQERVLAGGKLELEGRRVRECRLAPDPTGDRRRWTIALHEGRNRQVRRMFAAVGCRVADLVRVAVGPVQLGRLRPGDFRRLTADEERALRREAEAHDPQP